MIEKYFDGVVPTDKGAGPRNDWDDACAEHVLRARRAYDDLTLNSAAGEGLALLRTIDAYINETEPFKLAKAAATDPNAQARLASILYQCIEAVRIASLILAPVMPGKMQELWNALGCAGALSTGAAVNHGSFAEQARWGGLKPGTRVKKLALFPRVDLAKAEPAGAS